MTTACHSETASLRARPSKTGMTTVRLVSLLNALRGRLETSRPCACSPLYCLCAASAGELSCLSLRAIMCQASGAQDSIVATCAVIARVGHDVTCAFATAAMQLA